MHLLTVFISLTVFAFTAIGAAIPAEKTNNKLLGTPFPDADAVNWSFETISSNPEFSLLHNAAGETEVTTYGTTPNRKDDTLHSQLNGKCLTRDVSPHITIVGELVGAFRVASMGKTCVQTSDNQVAVFGVYKGASIIYSAKKGREISCDVMFDAIIDILTYCMLNGKVEGWQNVQYPDGSALVGIVLWTGKGGKDGVILPRREE